MKRKVSYVISKWPFFSPVVIFYALSSRRVTTHRNTLQAATFLRGVVMSRQHRRFLPTGEALEGGVFHATIMVLAFVYAPLTQAQSFQGLINQAHNQRDRYAGWRPPTSVNVGRSFVDPVEEAWKEKAAQLDREEAARLERQKAQFKTLSAQAGEALDRHDHRDALRLLKELRIAQRDAGIHNPRVVEAISRTGALLAWSEAKDSSAYHRAMRLNPGLFSKDNLRYVEGLEAIEKYERERPERAAAARAAMAKIHAVIDNLASSLADPRQPRRIVLTYGSEQGDPDLFNTRKSDPGRVADNGTSGEHDAVRSRLGFDAPGQFHIKEPLPPPPPSAVGRLVIPEDSLKDPAVLKLRDYEGKANEAKRTATAIRARFEDESAKSPNSGALPMLQYRAKEAESQAVNAENMVKVQTTEVLKTVKFASFDIGKPQKAPPSLPGNSSTNGRE